jgi:hypothetical protein
MVFIHVLTANGVVNVKEEIGGMGLLSVAYVAPTAVITIADLAGSGIGEMFQPAAFGLLEGRLLLENGIPANQKVRIGYALPASGVIDLTGHDLAGELMLDAGGSGNIVNGGALPWGALVWLGAGVGPVFSGTATFASVEGIINTEGTDLDGTVTITGDMNGQFAIRQSHFLSNATIHVGGDLGGWIASVGEPDVAGNLAGDIVVDGNLLGSIWAGANISGSVTIGGDVEGEIAADVSGYSGGEITGNVTVAGTFSGDICGDNLSGTWPLPSNFNIPNFGCNGRICGLGPFVPEPSAAVTAEGSRYLGVTVDPPLFVECPLALHIDQYCGGPGATHPISKAG